MDRHKEALDRLAEGTVIPAHPLALHADRKLDEYRQRLLARYYLAAGAGGLAVAVHTTQFAIRKPEIGLFGSVLRIAAEEMDAHETKTGRAVVKIAGVCGHAKQAVAEAETAYGLDYDAVLLSPGGLENLSEEEMLDRTRMVASILPVIGFYLQPSVGGRFFSYDYWKKMCEIDNVVAIKCASFNRYQTMDVVRAAALSSRVESIALYTGNDDNIIVDLLTQFRFTENGKTFEKRFIGGLLGHWAVWTNTAVRIYLEIKEAVRKEVIPASLLTLASEVTDANAAFFDAANHFQGCIAGIHEVLRRQGLLNGIWCLDQHEDLSPGQLEEIDRVYRMYPHLCDDEFVKNNLKYWL